MNPFDGLAKYLLGRLEQRILQNWARLIFQMGFSAVVSFLFTCGTVMLATRSALTGIGSGMVVASMSMMVLFRRTPQTAGMTVVLPGAEAEKEINTDWQISTKTGDKK
jgi:hypothetical protein